MKVNITDTETGVTTLHYCVSLEHLQIAERFQAVTGCNSEYLVVAIKRLFPEYRSYPADILEETLVSWIYAGEIGDR
jgi:hypothetical protein